MDSLCEYLNWLSQFITKFSSHIMIFSKIAILQCLSHIFSKTYIWGHLSFHRSPKYFPNINCNVELIFIIFETFLLDSAQTNPPRLLLISCSVIPPKNFLLAQLTHGPSTSLYLICGKI